jgi:AcrR family transcriptional regulator
MNKTKLSRREREKLSHKEEILDAALKLFSAKGFHNVSMQEIAEESEFGVGTLYKFFENKEALFEELRTSTGGHVIREFSEILDGPGTEKERLLKFIRYLPQFQEKHREAIKLFVSELGITGSKLSKFRDESKVHEVLNSKLAKLIKKGIDKGVFRAVDPTIAAKSLGATTETLALEISDRFEKDTVIEMFKKVEQLFLDGLLIPGGQKNE